MSYLNRVEPIESMEQAIMPPIAGVHVIPERSPGKFTCRERWRDASQFRLTVTMSLRRCKGEYLLVELQS